MGRLLRHTDYLMLAAILVAVAAVVYGTTDLLMVTVEPSFDCNLARSRVEKSICASKVLRQMDRQMLTDYRRLRPMLSEPGRFQARARQLRWLQSRDTGCFTGNETCLERAYRSRLNSLARELAEASRGT
jgi:uncharacterized protein